MWMGLGLNWQLHSICSCCHSTRGSTPYLRLQMGLLEQAKENQVKKKEEEALKHKMKMKALKECDKFTSKYAQCASGRTISTVWKCRHQFRELNDCLHQFTNEGVLEEMKKEYKLQQART